MVKLFTPSMDSRIGPVVFLDLDDTIFQTVRKMPPDTKAVPVIRKQDGSPSSFMTEKQWKFFQWLSRNALIIPVTGRSVEQLERVNLPFPSWRIVCHGAVIINADDQIDAHWRSAIQEAIAPLQSPLTDIKEICEDFFSCRPPLVRVRMEKVDEVGIYVCLKNLGSDGLCQKFHAVLDVIPCGDDFRVQVNGREICIIPKTISKGLAVKKLITDMGLLDVPILGFGDSLSDMSFLSMCDWWGTPRNSQISQRLECA